MVMPLEERSDAVLVGRCVEGDEEALDVLVRRHADALHRYCLYLTGNAEEADDLYQESWLRAITSLGQLQTGCALHTWLRRIAHNQFVDRQRQQRRRRTWPLPDRLDQVVPGEDEGPPERAEASEEHGSVVEALARLRDNYRTALVRREVEGRSFAEIANELQTTEAAVPAIVSRARRRLREEYEKRRARALIPLLINALRQGLPHLTSPGLGLASLAPAAILTAAAVGGSATPALLARSSGVSRAAALAQAMTPALSRSLYGPLPVWHSHLKTGAEAGDGARTGAANRYARLPEATLLRRPEPFRASRATARGTRAGMPAGDPAIRSWPGPSARIPTASPPAQRPEMAPHGVSGRRWWDGASLLFGHPPVPAKRSTADGRLVAAQLQRLPHIRLHRPPQSPGAARTAVLAERSSAGAHHPLSHDGHVTATPRRAQSGAGASSAREPKAAGPDHSEFRAASGTPPAPPPAPTATATAPPRPAASLPPTPRPTSSSAPAADAASDSAAAYPATSYPPREGIRGHP